MERTLKGAVACTLEAREEVVQVERADGDLHERS
jgi:hypothetical protein